MAHFKTRPRAQFTLCVIAFTVLHLGLEVINGGVVTHHLLASEDMPGVSNWWGLVVLPALAWCLYPFMLPAHDSAGILGLSQSSMYRLGGAIVYGGVIAVAFEMGSQQLPALMVGLLIPIGIVTPLYRAELLLGMIIGMTYTFGAILPTIVASVIGSASFLTYNSARFVVRKIRSVRQ